MRHAVLVAMSLAVLLGSMRSVHAEDEPHAAPESTQFLDSLAPGLTKAHRSGKLVFVWISRREPDELTGRIQRALFTGPGSRAIGEQAVAVRLRVGAPYDEKASALLRRYEIRDVPTFLILTADGALITNELTRSGEGILQHLAAGREAESRWTISEAEWKRAKDRETRRHLASVYRARKEWAKAGTVLGEMVKTEAQLEDQLALLHTLRHTGPDKRRVSLLQKLLAANPKDRRWVVWRIELALIGIARPLPISRNEYLASVPAQMKALRLMAAEVTPIEHQVEIHTSLARGHEELGELDGMRAECMVVRSKLEKLPKRPDLRRALAMMFVTAGAPEEAKTEFLRVVKEHPKSDEAPNALLGLAHVWYGEARGQESVLDRKAMDAAGMALEYLAKLETGYPDSEAQQHAREQAMPAVIQLIEEQMAASRSVGKGKDEPGGNKGGKDDK